MNTSAFDEALEAIVAQRDAEMQQVNKASHLLNSFAGTGMMSMDDVADVTAALPGALDGLGCESAITLEPSRQNFVLATEALSNTSKGILTAAIVALVALFTKFFKVSNTPQFMTGGGGGNRRSSPASTKAHIEEMTKVNLEAMDSAERFITLMKNFSGAQSRILDGDTTTLGNDIPSLLRAVNKMTGHEMPTYSREKDGDRIGAILNVVVKALEPGRFYYADFPPLNYMLLPGSETGQDLTSLEKFFEFIKRNDVLHYLAKKLFDMARGYRWTVDVYPGEKTDNYSQEIIDFFDRSLRDAIGVFDMARTLGVEPTDDPYETFEATNDRFKELYNRLFQTNLYTEKQNDPVVEKAKRDFYIFMTGGKNTSIGYFTESAQELADNCGDLIAANLDGKYADMAKTAEKFAQMSVQQHQDGMHAIAKRENMAPGDKEEDFFEGERLERLRKNVIIGKFLNSSIDFTGNMVKIIMWIDRIETGQQGMIAAAKTLNEELDRVSAKLEGILR